MKDSIEIIPVTRPLDATILPPGSKSITNRALVCAALAEGESTLTGALDSEDTQVMIDALRHLGIAVRSSDEGRTLHIAGCGGRIPAATANLFVANSGTTMRFLTALAALGHGTFRLDGVERMRQRPIADLAAALEQLGARVTCESGNDCPPIVVDAQGLRGGRANVRGDVSSQFLSGLLMAAPYAAEPVQLEITCRLVSVPYVVMTQRVMEAFGGQLTASSDYAAIEVSNRHRYHGRAYAIEPDASAASYFFAAAAIAGGRATVEGLDRHSLQGDIRFCECLASMGVRVDYADDAITVTGGPLRGIDVDMNDISDTVQTLAVVALFARGATTIRNVAHIRHKETDRLAATARELRKLGADVNELDDGLRIEPRHLRGAAIDTYNDHRMAMSFALAGLRTPNVVIRNPECTAKTYPRFFEDFSEFTASAR